MMGRFSAAARILRLCPAGNLKFHRVVVDLAFGQLDDGAFGPAFFHSLSRVRNSPWSRRINLRLRLLRISDADIRPRQCPR